jgi:thioredoxin 2
MANLDFDDQGILVTCNSCGKKNRLSFEKLSGAVRCGECKNPLPAVDMPVELHSAVDFDRLVKRSSLPVLVDYWAPWCGPCRMVAPELQKVAARQSGKLLVVKVNTDELSDLGERFNIRSIPTLAVFANGRELARASGARQASDIEAWAQQAAHSATASSRTQ